MSFKSEYPEYAAIEQHIRRAHAERAVVIANLLAGGILAVVRGLRRLVVAYGAGKVPSAARKPLVVKAHLA